MVSAGIIADRADVIICQSTAHLAIVHILPGINYGISKLVDSVLGQIYQVKSQSLSGLASNPWKGSELFNSTVDMSAV